MPVDVLRENGVGEARLEPLCTDGEKALVCTVRSASNRSVKLEIVDSGGCSIVMNPAVVKEWSKFLIKSEVFEGSDVEVSSSEVEGEETEKVKLEEEESNGGK